MADPEHLDILKQGVSAWNKWKRGQDIAFRPDLSGADLRQMSLAGADFRHTILFQADLRKADLCEAVFTGTVVVRVGVGGARLKARYGGADLREADLRQAELVGADLSGADLSKANLSGANLSRARVSHANLGGANLSEANLSTAILLETSLENADLSGCYVYGISAWGLNLNGAVQTNIIITNVPVESPIQVDNLEMAQFIYLLLYNEKIRYVIDTITSKVVLILGRFTADRKAVLDGIRQELRKRDYLPVLFDFEKPASRDLTETISTLAHMARFVVADITDAKGIPQELERIVPDLPSVPVQPLLMSSQQEYGMFEHFRRYPWVLEPVLYDDQQKLLVELDVKVIAPAEAKAKEQRAK
jgi:hypothetical protein